MAAEGLPSLGQAGKGEANRSGPTCHYPPSTIRTSSITPRPKQKPDAQEPRRSRSGDCCKPTRSSAFRSREQKLLAGVAVDAVFDSVSVATTFKEKLAELGIIFCSFSEAVHEHPELVQEVSRLGGARTATTSSPR